MQNNSLYGVQELNRDVISDLKKYDGQIEEELKKDKPDRDAILKLRMGKLLRGMEIGTLSGRRYNGIPY